MTARISEAAARAQESARRGDGTFGAQERTSPEASLAGMSISDRMAQAWLDEDRDAAGQVRYALGEEAFRHAESAKNATDPALVGLHMLDRRGDVALNAAKNPHAPSHALHYLMVETDRAYQHEARIAAVRHPNADPESIRHAVEFWDARANDPRSHEETGSIASYVSRAAASAPNTPADLLAEMHTSPRTLREASANPNLPRECVQAAIDGDSYTRRLIMENPALTAEDISAVVEHATRDYTDDEGEVGDEMFTLFLATKHPNTGAQTYRALARHPDRHVAKTAGDRITGDFLRDGLDIDEAIQREQELLAD